MTEYTCDSFRFFNLFPVYFGGKGTLGINLQGYMFDKSDDAQASLDAAAEEVNEILADEAKEYGE